MPFVIRPPSFSADCSDLIPITNPDDDEKSMLRDLWGWGWDVTQCELDDDEYVDALRELRWSLEKHRQGDLVGEEGGRTLKQIWAREGKKSVRVTGEGDIHGVEEADREGCSGAGAGAGAELDREEYVYDDEWENESLYDVSQEKQAPIQNHPPTIDPEIARQQDFFSRLRHGEQLVRSHIQKTQRLSQDPGRDLYHQNEIEHPIRISNPLAKYYKYPRPSIIKTNISPSKPSPYIPRYVYKSRAPRPKPKHPSSQPTMCCYTFRLHRPRPRTASQKAGRRVSTAQPRPATQIPAHYFSPPQSSAPYTRQQIPLLPTAPYELDIQYTLLFPNEHRTVQEYLRSYRPMVRAEHATAPPLERAGLGEDPYGWLAWDGQRERERERERVVEERMNRVRGKSGRVLRKER
ncbi:hypothetical protein P153DRAFT_357009 [Dothidotthia symphoricarpi CBS 119687]|uniref:Uncharacterized protein n=1 Tax=Dothidotthia symphoricarpi CBS 119687 TaxID=1392245 RepID=A0A6A6AG86_9PLEO|nr:uncharacterized protein P153DRAFT_357009 [Dothidotthia symphoricarpi CBS 119687]KAF2129431.1 hypothetical protein P153DRAFT_357009 [Dothidotthia symphoricarpi CBS 119687]